MGWIQKQDIEEEPPLPETDRSRFEQREEESGGELGIDHLADE